MLYPPRCLGCAEFLGGDSGPFCDACSPALLRLDGPACPRCGVELGPDVGSRLCTRCQVSPPPYARCASAYGYGGALRDAIARFKYEGAVHFAPRLAGLGAASFAPLAEGAHAALPVPLHLSRLRRRGYNQSLLLALGLARPHRVRVLRDCLRRDRDTPPQVDLEASSRRENVRGAFSVRRPDLVQGRAVVLVDDVLTTGATVSECASALLASGASQVRVFTLARTI
jgi:ComF family protein